MDLPQFEDRIVPATLTASALTPAIEGTGMDLGTTGYYRIWTDSPFAFSQAVYLAYSGTATNGTHYTASTSVSIPAYADYVDVPITPHSNSSATGTLTVIATIQPDWLSAYTVGSPATATTNVYDDDTTRVTVSVQGGYPTEGDSSGFRISRTGSTSGNLAVNFITGGSATSGTDFTSIGTSATILDGNSYVDVTVATLPDNLVEFGGDSLSIFISDSGTNYSAYGSSSFVAMAILDDPPILTVATISDAEEGGDDGVVRFTRSGGDLTSSLDVDFSVGGNATEGEDYDEIIGLITISANSTTFDTEIQAFDDDTTDPYESVTLTVLTSDSHLGGTPASCDVMIVENDGKISGHAWHDEDSDGVEDTGEIRLWGIPVEVWDGELENVLASDMTDENGEYELYCPSTDSQFIIKFGKPAGYSFTTSNVDSNGYTDPIGVAPYDHVQNVNAGMAGHAPIIFEASVYVEAFDGASSDMDLTANGFDPDGDDLEAVIVASPTGGSLTYDSGDGVYYYTASSSSTFIDTFTYYLTDGTHASDVVTVSILSHEPEYDSTDFRSYPLMGGAMYVGNGGLPDTFTIKQQGSDDCWLVAAAAGLTALRPARIPSIISLNLDATIDVTIAGRVANISLAADGHNYSDGTCLANR